MKLFTKCERCGAEAEVTQHTIEEGFTGDPVVPKDSVVLKEDGNTFVELVLCRRCAVDIAQFVSLKVDRSKDKKESKEEAEIKSKLLVIKDTSTAKKEKKKCNNRGLYLTSEQQNWLNTHKNNSLNYILTEVTSNQRVKIVEYLANVYQINTIADLLEAPEIPSDKKIVEDGILDEDGAKRYRKSLVEHGIYMGEQIVKEPKKKKPAKKVEVVPIKREKRRTHKFLANREKEPVTAQEIKTWGDKFNSDALSRRILGTLYKMGIKDYKDFIYYQPSTNTFMSYDGQTYKLKEATIAQIFKHLADMKLMACVGDKESPYDYRYTVYFDEITDSYYRITKKEDYLK